MMQQQWEIPPTAIILAEWRRTCVGFIGSRFYREQTPEWNWGKTLEPTS
jgi:hypothetical protein